MNACLQEGGALPDVATEPQRETAAALAWVGMHGIDLPLALDADPAALRAGNARADAWVNLPAGAGRGIHMSRLYTHLETALATEPLSREALQRALAGFLDSHAGISQRARLELRFDLLACRRALLSERSGWKAYPVRLVAQLEGERLDVELECGIGYSSTCPASAALARQLIQQRFAERFPAAAVDSARVRAWLGTEEGVSATPHGQRSEARVRVRLAAAAELEFLALIDAVEAALATPLQTAVKRVDEQEFARLNGANLMFCEDAARRVHGALDADARWADFAVRCAHFESLHPHDAVAVAVKGVPGGWSGF